MNATADALMGGLSSQDVASDDLRHYSSPKALDLMRSFLFSQNLKTISLHTLFKELFKMTWFVKTINRT